MLLLRSRHLLHCCLGGIVCFLAVVRADEASRHSGIDPDGFDLEARPQDDLYQHVNGRWLLRTEIPSDKSNYGSFTALDDAARENIRTIIEEAAANPEGATGRKVGDFYRSFMDEATINARGISPLLDAMQQIDSLKTPEQVVRHFGVLQTFGIDGPIGFFVSTDPKNSNRYLAAIVQSGTTLPDRDFYLQDADNYVKARSAFKTYIARLFELSNLPGGSDAADQILDLETRLATANWTRTELRDAEKRYNLFQVSELSQLAPMTPWSTFFDSVGTAGLTEVNVLTPSYFREIDALLKETPVSAWQNYMRFHLLDSSAPFLTKDYVDAHFLLHDKTISGVPEQMDRWKRAVEATSGGGGGDFGALGEAVGELYVKRHFPESAKRRMDELVANLLTAYERSIHDLPWMTEATRVRALDKLSKITPKIGYPTQWRDYSALEIAANDLLGNMRRSAEFEHQRMINKLGKPVDKLEWGMTPQTVNAYYNPSKNEIVFPAAILQPPFFDAMADDAVNYGGIGAVIGHEISHGFDDQGSKFDGDGNLNNWWTDEDRAAFEKLTSALVAQFAGYEALPGKNLNGQLTLGENIADLSGMAIALKAYRLSLEGKPAPVIDGHTGDQRFFLGWAQIWRRKYRDEELTRRLLVDPHSPSVFRANGPVGNLDAFYEAFDVKPGDKLFKPKEQRIQIW